VAAVYIAFSISAPNNEKVFELFCLGGSGFTLELPPSKTDLIVPFFKTVSYPLGIVGFIVLYLPGHCRLQQCGEPDRRPRRPRHHADGDGGAALGIFAYVAGHAGFSKYLLLPHIPGAGELAVFCGAWRCGLGFLWFNAYPAEVFMGDVGALALGAALGTVAVVVRQEIVLFIMGGVFVAETLSVMIQVSYFKYTARNMARDDASCAWRPCTTTSSKPAGRKRRWWCASGSSPSCWCCSGCRR
jgi:phospho-N-acetylmuramoyl-pentapeptide-transferase